MPHYKPKHPLVCVTWLDAHSYDGDGPVDECDHKPLPIDDYGLLLIDDEEGVTLATCQTGDATHRSKSFIPRSLVDRVEIIRKNTKRA